MSYKDGIAAINLEMTDRIPRTEYSALSHWELVSKVTGDNIDETSSEQDREKAKKMFLKAWNYDFNWSILTSSQIFEGKHTYMGHAEYASGGMDYNTNTFQLYDDPFEALKFDP